MFRRECLVDDLVGLRRQDVPLKTLLRRERPGEHIVETPERLVVAFIGGGDRLLHQVVAGNVERIDRIHAGLPRPGGLRLQRQPRPPLLQPAIAGGRIDEQVPDLAGPLPVLDRVRQVAEGLGEVRLIGRHPLQQLSLIHI